jgi:hypothetical protein
MAHFPFIALALVKIHLFAALGWTSLHIAPPYPLHIERLGPVSAVLHHRARISAPVIYSFFMYTLCVTTGLSLAI